MEQKQKYPSKWHLCFSALLKSMYLLYSTTGVKHKKHKVIPNLISCFWCCLFQEWYFPVGKIWDDTWEPTSECQQHFAWCAASFSQRVFSLCYKQVTYNICRLYLCPVCGEQCHKYVEPKIQTSRYHIGHRQDVFILSTLIGYKCQTHIYTCLNALFYAEICILCYLQH